jgi:CheY-like chemotaxis protein
MRFPLYQRPNALVFLDDDASYLEMLALVMPRNWCVRLYTHVDDCIEYLRQERGLWEADVWSHQHIANNSRTGMSPIRQILSYWTNDTHRYGLTKIFIVDFSMPAITGLEVLNALPEWPPSRLLLTGKADEFIAISAFNQGLIDMFVPKQQPDVGKHLTGMLSNQNSKPLDSYEGIWRSLLKKEQHDVLQESSIQLHLLKLIQEKEWVEYVVVSAPFGILGLDKHAQAQWLQLELHNDLGVAVDLAQSTGQSTATVQKIRDGTHLLNTELLMALDSTDDVTMNPAFKIGDYENLIGAYFTVSQGAIKGVGHHQFLLSMLPRSVTQID